MRLLPVLLNQYWFILNWVHSSEYTFTVYALQLTEIMSKSNSTSRNNICSRGWNTVGKILGSISIRRESVRSMSNWCRSEGLCYLGIGVWSGYFGGASQPCHLLSKVLNERHFKHIFGNTLKDKSRIQHFAFVLESIKEIYVNVICE